MISSLTNTYGKDVACEPKDRERSRTSSVINSIFCLTVIDLCLQIKDTHVNCGQTALLIIRVVVSFWWAV